jgi:exopolyphosphatase/guanosine-5'-triphosphate,3'-diphosphate pyrophosphatase
MPISRDGLEKLRGALLRAGDAAKLGLPGLKDDRIAVLPGGFAIMSANFSELDVEHMELATGAMRQGILWDMIGRAHRRDMRELTVRQFVKRYHVDATHAHRVERLALKLFEQLAEGGKYENEYPMQMLSWAARLQEIGLTVVSVITHPGRGEPRRRRSVPH